MSKGRFINAKDNHHWEPSCQPGTGIRYAVLNNDVELANSLLQSGKGNVNLEVTVGGGTKMPAIYHAVLYGHVRMVRTLCKYGADVDQKSGQGAMFQTPLSIAVHSANLEMVIALCEGGANVNARWAGHTVLMLACKSGMYEVVKQLLESHPDINVRTSNGDTALHMACVPHFINITSWANPKILEILLAQSNLEYDVRNAKGQTPMDLIFSNTPDLCPAELDNKLKMIKMFVHAGFSVNQEVLGKLLSLMQGFLDGIAVGCYGTFMQGEVEGLNDEFCAAVEMCFAAGCSASDIEHRVMASDGLSPVLKANGIQDYAFGACSKRTPGSLKRLSKLSVRHYLRTPIGQNVQQFGLPKLLLNYILLRRNDLD